MPDALCLHAMECQLACLEPSGTSRCLFDFISCSAISNNYLCNGHYQDLLNLERLKKELVEKHGGEPTFAQWAGAAGVDQKTLRKHLTHGRFCKDKMIKSNIRLVISIAKNFKNAGLSLQDLVLVLAFADNFFRIVPRFSMLNLPFFNRKDVRALSEVLKSLMLQRDLNFLPMHIGGSNKQSVDLFLSNQG